MLKKNMKFSAAFLFITLFSSSVYHPGTTIAAETIGPEQVKISDGEITKPLTEKAGDPGEGKNWFSSRKLGNCLACHANEKMSDLPFHGEIGPAMDGVAERYTATQLRAILVNAKAVFGDETVMPGFYRVDPGQRTAKKFQGKTILSGQQIEDIIAYLLTLKE